ncbi:MAG: hypothetical protein C4583_03045 [Anaerolineaceae bacterium]|nr:MAG: hypothetical protein C4583_03045 [Anaerolineaceae bacterium]
MALKIVTPPAQSPISLATAKAHLRVDHSSEDALIQDLINEATDYLDGYSGILGRCIITQTWDLFWDAWPCDGDIKVPLPPLQSVTWVKYLNTSEVWTTVSAADYDVDLYSTFGWVVPGSAGWPTDLFDGINVVNVRFVAGFGATPDTIPARLRGAMKLMIGRAYKNREGIRATAENDDGAIARALAPLNVTGF